MSRLPAGAALAFVLTTVAPGVQAQPIPGQPITTPSGTSCYFIGTGLNTNSALYPPADYVPQIAHCCSPGNVAILSLCTQKQQPLNYLPPCNGCGPISNEVVSGIIDVVATFGLVDFTPACNGHDACYGTCKAAQATCDSDFLSTMQEECRAGYQGSSDGALSMFLYLCLLYANGFYKAVHDYAEPVFGAYTAGQQAACYCCDDCSDAGPDAAEDATDASCSEMPLGFTVTCTSSGQTCSPAYEHSIAIGSDGTSAVEFTLNGGACSSVSVTFLMDGTPVAQSGLLSAGDSTGPITISSTPGVHTLAIQAMGVSGGCNMDDLLSWGGTLQTGCRVPVPDGGPSNSADGGEADGATCGGFGAYCPSAIYNGGFGPGGACCTVGYECLSLAGCPSGTAAAEYFEAGSTSVCVPPGSSLCCKFVGSFSCPPSTECYDFLTNTCNSLLGIECLNSCPVSVDASPE